MRVTAVMLAALVLVSVFAGAASSGQPSGLRGVVMRGPTKPVCRIGEPCEEPAKSLVLQFRRDGILRAKVTTNSYGKYVVRLRPGRYGVTTPKLRVGQGLTPRFVRVPRGKIGRVDFHLDTGIQ